MAGGDLGGAITELAGSSMWEANANATAAVFAVCNFVDTAVCIGIGIRSRRYYVSQMKCTHRHSNCLMGWQRMRL